MDSFTGLAVFVVLVAFVIFLRFRGEPSGLATPTGQLASVQDLLAAGRKIDAIKLYRQQNGGGLKEAKESVEAMQQGLTQS